MFFLRVQNGLKMNAGQLSNFLHFNAKKCYLLQRIEANYLFSHKITEICLNLISNHLVHIVTAIPVCTSSKTDLNGSF